METKLCNCGIPAVSKVSKAGKDYLGCSKKKSKKNEAGEWVTFEGCDFFEFPKKISTDASLQDSNNEIKLQLDVLHKDLEEIKSLLKA